jgi:hypothetical protein
LLPQDEQDEADVIRLGALGPTAIAVRPRLHRCNIIKPNTVGSAGTKATQIATDDAAEKIPVLCGRFYLQSACSPSSILVLRFEDLAPFVKQRQDEGYNTAVREQHN